MFWFPGDIRYEFMSLLFPRVDIFLESNMIIWLLVLAFASLESLGQDKTFKSLESLVRLFQKVLKLIILWFWMILAGKLLQKTQKFWHLKKIDA